MEIAAGQNVVNSVVAQLGVQMQAVATRIGEVETNLKSDLATVKTDLAAVKTDLVAVKTDLAVVKTDLGDVKTDVAVLKKEVRLIWAGLFLAVPTPHRRGHPSLRRLNGKPAPTGSSGLSGTADLQPAPPAAGG